jgi:hypothetical protein
MISRAEWQQLAELYDRGANSLDPFDTEAGKAMDEFLRQVNALYAREDPSSIRFQEFKSGVIRQCKSLGGCCPGIRSMPKTLRADRYRSRATVCAPVLATGSHLPASQLQRSAWLLLAEPFQPQSAVYSRLYPFAL